MQPIVTDEVAWSVCWFVTIVRPAKTTQPIEWLFGLWTRVGLGNYVLDGGPILIGGRGVPL